MLRLANPWMLLGLLLIPIYLYLELRLRADAKLRLPFARMRILQAISTRNRTAAILMPVLRCLLIFTIVIALSRPQWGRGVRDINHRGVDIVLAVDVSGSMLAMDFAPNNRLDAAVAVARDFIQKRPNDRFALVAFSEYSITQSPLTFDHRAMLEQLDKLRVNTEASGTAIGMGLAKAVSRLKDSRAKSKLVILITDGVNNWGEIDPITAARMASTLGIRVYPIGVGSGGPVDFPYQHPLFGIQYRKVQIDMDMQTLNQIASITGTGEAALATDNRQFAQIMRQIDQLEKTDYQVKLQYDWHDRFSLFLWLAFLLIMLELLLRLELMPVLPD